MNIKSLPREHALNRLKQLGCEYDAESNLDFMDQLLICGSIAEATPVNTYDEDGKIILKIKECSTKDRYDSDNCSVNGSYKHRVNTIFSPNQHSSINQLNRCNYRTNPKIIASLLETIFIDYPSEPGHWFSVAQRWPPRRIYLVLNYIRSLENPGHITVRNPAAYFTFLIRHRIKRKSILNIR